MVEICKLRETLDRAEASFAVAAARVRTAQMEVTRFPTDVHLVSELARLANEAAQAESVRDAARAAFDETGDPLGPLNGDLPLVLLPVRIETAYLPGAGGGLDLVVRIYPDDIHVDSHEPELTQAEQSAGADYWASDLGRRFESGAAGFCLDRFDESCEGRASGVDRQDARAIDVSPS